MSLHTTSGDPVHYPARRDLFQFDNEVASIFDNMAPRSIPMYNEVHRLHVSMFRHLLKPNAVVADIGSSTGHLFRNIERQLSRSLSGSGITGVAVDVSAPMMERLSTEFPSVVGLVRDITELEDLPPLLRSDLTFCLYTLQFIPNGKKAAAVAWLARNTNPGGALILGQKEVINPPDMEALFASEYYQFRRDNGYSQEEIDIKTQALKGSMFPISHNELKLLLDAHGFSCVETSRWLQFSTLACIRRS